MRSRCCTVAACRDPLICHYGTRGGRYCCYGSRHAATVQQLRDPHKPKDECTEKGTTARRQRGCTVAACRDPIICHYRMRGESYHCYGSRHAATVQQLHDPRKPKDERAAKVTAAMGRGMPRPYIPCASFINRKMSALRKLLLLWVAACRDRTPLAHPS